MALSDREIDYVPVEKIRRLYSELQHKISASEVAAQMFQDGALRMNELIEIQHIYSQNDVEAATYLLNIVLVRPAYVYRSFLRALEKTNQFDAYLLLTDEEYELAEDPQHIIQTNYVHLLSEVDTLHTDLLDRLLSDFVLTNDEKAEIDKRTLPTKRCEKLLAILRRKTHKQFEIFLEELEATNQSHIASVLKQKGSDDDSYVKFLQMTKPDDRPQPPPHSSGPSVRPPKPPVKPNLITQAVQTSFVCHSSSSTSPTAGSAAAAAAVAAEEAAKVITAIVVQQYTGDSAIRGIASTGNRLFVLYRRQQHQLEELDAHHWRLQRQMSVPDDWRHLSDMALCQRHGQLYISHNTSDCVHVLKITASEEWSKWKTDGSPFGLSVTPDTSNVLVTVRYKGRVDEYSPQGQRLRSVNLHRVGAISPWHAVQLSSVPSQPELFVVGHGDREDTTVRVGVVRLVDGVVERWYGAAPGNSEHLLSRPQHLALGRDGTLAVADVLNDRVVLLNEELQRVGIVGTLTDRAAGWNTARVCWIGRRLCVAQVQLNNGKFVASRLILYELQISSTMC